MTDRMEREAPINQNSVALQMVIDEVRQIRTAQQEQAVETREELRRIRDKLDAFRDEVHDALGGHDRDIVRLTTQASMAGRVSGFFAGTIAGIITAIVIDVLRHAFWGA